MTAPVTDTEPGHLPMMPGWIGPTGHGQTTRIVRRAPANGQAIGPQRPRRAAADADPAGQMPGRALRRAVPGCPGLSPRHRGRTNPSSTASYKSIEGFTQMPGPMASGSIGDIRGLETTKAIPRLPDLFSPMASNFGHVTQKEMPML